WTLVRDESGSPRSVLVINTDVTAKKRIEAQFLRAQRMESIGTLASGIAHDLNNVLSPILMAIRMFQLKFTDPESQNLLATIRASAERGAGLVKQVLAFARGVEGDRIALQPRHLIKEVVKILGDTLPKAIAIKYNVAEDLWPLAGDPTQLHQVLMNLCVNARDAMPLGGRLSIEAENVTLDENYASMTPDARPGKFVRITVADAGVGIPPENITKIFEPFFTTKDHGQGTGLGLSTALGIIRSHGGFVNVYSEHNKGTQFRVYVPAIDTEHFKQPEEPRLALPAGHGELILVADDEAAIREITQSTLQTYGYKVVTAADGTEVIALYAEKRDQIKAVILDMMMPYMDGPAAARALQKLNPAVKIVATSGLKANGNLTAADLGARAFISKPYTADKLLHVLSDVLSRD
ncbi:MAG TPA: ATP-binding protein, partial [Blastocatellia bacterium]|nr:ATP-binding protein [Blastocatellia bacterium]